jgi:LPS sulfotransferase NodH
MADGELLPHFIIGGAPRSGTTMLAEVLDRHSAVVIARPLIPEPKVFMTPDAERRGYGPFFDAADTGRVRGEKTSYYLESDDARKAIAAALPDVRMVFIVREPIERALSNWRWSRQNGIETLSFEAAVEQPDRPSPLPADRAYARPFDYLSRGEYARMARAWHDALGPEQVGFYVFERLIADPDATLRGIQEFVGVDPEPLGPLPTVLGNETSPQDGNVVDPEVRERLRERYRPEVDEFAALTGADVSLWGYG